LKGRIMSFQNADLGNIVLSVTEHLSEQMKPQSNGWEE
jgi:hypothetical protein